MSLERGSWSLTLTISTKDGQQVEGGLRLSSTTVVSLGHMCESDRIVGMASQPLTCCRMIV